MQELWKNFTKNYINCYYDPGPGVRVDFYTKPLLSP